MCTYVVYLQYTVRVCRSVPNRSWHRCMSLVGKGLTVVYLWTISEPHIPKKRQALILCQFTHWMGWSSASTTCLHVISCSHAYMSKSHTTASRLLKPQSEAGAAYRPYLRDHFALRHSLPDGKSARTSISCRVYGCKRRGLKGSSTRFFRFSEAPNFHDVVGKSY